MDKREQNLPGKRDWRISITLLAVWIVALVVISKSGSTIPVSMLAIASVFFVVLIPAMNDLVRSIERYFVRNFRSHGRKHDGID